MNSKIGYSGSYFSEILDKSISLKKNYFRKSEKACNRKSLHSSMTYFEPLREKGV